MVEDEQLTQTELQDEQIENAILNETKDIAQKTTDKTLDLVKNSADKATRDFRDAAKKAAKEASKKTMKAIGKVITSAFTAILPYVLIIAIVVAFFAGIAYFLEIETAKDMTQNIYESMEIVEDEGDIANIVEIVEDSDGYHLEFVEGFDKKLEDAIKKLEDAIKKLNQENKSIDLSNKETLKKFIMAEVKTKFPYLQGEDDGKDKFQGSIIIKRYTPDKNIGALGEAGAKEPITLKYVAENVFQSYINNGDSNALYVYTLDENKNLITATWSYSSDTGTVMQANSPMDYRSATARYTMPFEYPLFFLIDSDCEDFCTSLAQLAMDSSMEIAIIDNVTDTKTVTTVETTTNETRDFYDIKDGKQFYRNSETTSSTTTTSTEVITESVYTNIQVANVKSWATKKDCEITLNSSSQAGTPVSTNGSPSGINHNLVKETDKEKEYLITSQSIVTTITSDVYENRYDVTDSEVEENTEEFVKIYNDNKDKLNNNMIPDWLFEIMEENPKTVNLIDLTRYLLYKATGKDYGVKNFEDIDFSELLGFDNISGYNGNDIMFDFIASWENTSLYEYMKSDSTSGYNSTPYIYKCVTQDKKKYKCVEDIGRYNGTRNFGFGVCHYNPNDVGLMKQELYAEEGINIAESKYLQEGTELDVEIVDRIKRKIIDQKRIEITNLTQGLDLSENQINALIDLSYQRGNINGFVTAYKTYGNTEQLRNNFSFNDPNPRRTEARWQLFHNGVYKLGTGEIVDPRSYVGGAGGEEKLSTQPGIKGYFTSQCSGRTYIEYYQNDGAAWHWESGCWVCSQATIMSGFGSKYTPNKIPGFYGLAQQNTWKQYGNCEYERVYSVNAADIKKYLLQGHAIHIRCEGRTLITDNGSHYFNGHSMVLLDYKNENGKDKVYLFDPYKGDPTYGWTDLNTLASCLTWYEHVWQ